MSEDHPIIRVAVIGTGQIGKWHLETYTSKVEGVEIAAVCDINVEEAKRVAQKYNIPDVYSNFREVIPFSLCQAIRPARAL